MKDGYFPHDINSHDDEKILRLIQDLKWEGYGLFWGIIERLHGAGGWLKDDCEGIAYAMRTDAEIIRKVIHDYHLFMFKDGHLSSKRVLKNIKMIIEKSAKASDSAKKRWYANAMRPQCDGNAIKESKVKERKEHIETVSPNVEKRPLTDLQKVVKGWKFLNEVPLEGSDSQSWDRAHFARCSRSAKTLLDLFGYPGAVQAMEYVFDWLKSKKLDCTIETIVKHSDKYREVMDHGSNNGKDIASLPVIGNAIKTITSAGGIK
jgi:uncharacterized protein YdaU (DUF1376 family)